MRLYFSFLLLLIMFSGASAYEEISSTTSTTLWMPAVENHNIIIQGTNYEPAPAEPGNYLDIYTVIRNEGNDDLNDFYVAIDPSYPFYLMGSETGTEFVDQLSSGREKLTEFRLMVDDQALSGSYNLYIKICKDAFCDKEIKRMISTVSVSTGGKPKLEIGIDDHELFIPGSLGEIIITSVNKGKLGIQFLTIEMIDSEDYEIISTPRKYLGELQTDDFERENYQIHVNPNIKDTKDITVLLEIEYSDDNYKTYKTQEEITFKVYSKADAKKIGLIENSSSGKMIFLLLIIGFIGYRWMRKKKSKNVT